MSDVQAEHGKGNVLSCHILGLNPYELHKGFSSSLALIHCRSGKLFCTVAWPNFNWYEGDRTPSDFKKHICLL